MNPIFAILTTLILAAGQWTPIDYPQFWFAPETESELRFAAQPGTEPDAAYVIRNSGGKEILSARGTILPFEFDSRYNTGTPQTSASSMPKQYLSIKLKLSQGYYELEFPGSKQIFGLGVLPMKARPTESRSDPFFAIDGALSGLARTNDIRKGLIQSAKKIGIDMIRERISWRWLEIKENDFKWVKHYSDEYRFFYKENGVEVLELFHDSPEWIGQIEKKYPKDLNKARKSWRTIAEKWSPTWGAIEIWNEPDISFGANLPADQYVPLLKSLYQMFKAENITVPIVGGVNANFNEGWMESAAQSRMFDSCDVYSFHTYQKADQVENLYQKYHLWMKKYGHEGMPVWITECGRPWKIGPARALGKEDLVSAIDIVMKGCEARACGFDRYFPFVYSYYEERQNNFGMTGKEGSPLRSIAAYAEMIRMLADTEYLGDLKNILPNVSKARIFADRKGKKTLVLYRSKIQDGARIELPFTPSFVEEVTGEIIDPRQKSFDFSDGFLYIGIPDSTTVEIEKETLPGKIRKERLAARPAELRKIAQRAQADLAPFVLRFDHSSVKDMTFTPGHYSFAAGTPGEIKLGFEVINFDRFISHRASADQKKNSAINNEIKTSEFKIIATEKNPSGKAIVQAPKTISVKPGQSGRFEIVLRTDGISTITPCAIDIAVTSEKFSDSVHLNFTREIDPKNFSEDFLKKYLARIKRLPMTDAKKWFPSCAGCGKMKFLSKEQRPQDSECSFDVNFKKGDHWIYPLFDPKMTDMSAYDGFVLCAKAEVKDPKTTEVRMLIEEEEGENWIVSDSIIPADGKWHLSFVPFTNFHFLQAHRNGIFESNRVKYLKFGCNTKENAFKMDLRDLYLYKVKNNN